MTGRPQPKYFAPSRKLLFAFVAAASLAVLPRLAAQTPVPTDPIARLLQTRECAGCDFTKANLSPRDLTGVDVHGANFAGALLYRAILTKADLSNTDLHGANLVKATLTGANLSAANLAGADLTDATGADLSTAITDGTTTCPSGLHGPCR